MNRLLPARYFLPSIISNAGIAFLLLAFLVVSEVWSREMSHGTMVDQVIKPGTEESDWAVLPYPIGIVRGISEPDITFTADHMTNCRDIQVSIDGTGNVVFSLSDLLTLASPDLFEIFVFSPAGELIFHQNNLTYTDNIQFSNACRFIGKSLQVMVVSPQLGSCQSTLFIKSSLGPYFGPGRSVDVWCTDELVTEGDIQHTKPLATVPCGGYITAKFVADWITPYDCDPGVQDTAKVIYREYEVFDKAGRRASVMDTIVVFRFPELNWESFFCPGNLHIYCGDSTSFLSPTILVSNGVLDTVVELVKMKINKNTRDLEFYPVYLDSKCGVQLHLDYWKIGNNSCEEQYRVVLELKQSCPGSPNQFAATVISPNAFVPLDADSTYWRCEFWVTDTDTLPPVLDCKDDHLGLTTVYTNNHDCAAHTYAPALYAKDDWTGLKQVKVTIREAGSVLMTFDPVNKCYVSHTLFELPHRELPYLVLYEAYDSCHNIGRDSCYLRVKDRTPPIAVSEKGVTVSITGKKAWLDVETLDEGSWDNCGVNLLLARRSDWYESCINLCDSVDTCWVSPHHDLIWQAFLEPDKHLDEVESHYAMTMDWLCNDGTPCGELLYNAWIYDLMKYATIHCQEHPYPVDGAWFDHLVRTALYDPGFASKWKNPSALFVGSSRFGNSQNDAFYIPNSGDPIPVFPELGVWAATTDFANERILFTSSFEGFDNEGNILYALPFGGVQPVKLGRIKNLGGNDSIRIDGLAISNGILYGSQQFDRANSRGIYRINLATLEAELVLFVNGDASMENSGIGGIDADPLTQKIYGADDINKRIVEIDLAAGIIKKIVDYPLGVTDIDGVAVGSGRIYLVPSVSGPLRVYNLADGVYENVVNSPLTIPENFSAGAAFMPVLEEFVDQWNQLGGGWSKAVPLSCDDACGPVTVEILAMDYWCNWSTAWTTVWVEDKTPISVAKELVDGTITCKVYRENRYLYPGEDHQVSLEYIVSKAQLGDLEALNGLDEIFGGYCKAWVDPYGKYVDENGQEIECDIWFYDSICECTSTLKQVRVYDEHLGYVWKDSLITTCYYRPDTTYFQKGIVAVNCAENVYCEQEVWSEIDHCGQGYIFRKFKIWQGCPANDLHDSGHIPDTIYRHQKIQVGNECRLDKYMFEVPYDTEVFSCGLEYGPDGNVIGDAGPDQTGYAKYRFDDDCRIVGIGHEDKVFKIVGGDAACYKIVRTWYFADWCGYGFPVEGRWWQDESLVLEKCVQKIIVYDTVAPRCWIEGPVESGGVVEVASCDYDLRIFVGSYDACGLASCSWEIKKIEEHGSYVVDAGEGELKSLDSAGFEVVIEDLMPGSYLFKTRITDECNLESYCEYRVEVVSIKKPTPVCVSSLTARLTPWDSDGDGTVDTAHAVVWAREFDRSSSGACDEDSLEYRIEWIKGNEDDLSAAGDLDYLALGCQDVGTRLVRVWVISHPSGSSDFCDALLVVQAGASGCEASSQGYAGMHKATEKVENRETKGRWKPSSDEETEITMRSNWSDLVHDGTFQLFQNRPNPVKSNTMVGFYLPEASDTEFLVFDVRGQLLKKINQRYNKGYHELDLEIDAVLQSTGILYYQLETEKHTATRKMVILN